MKRVTEIKLGAITVQVRHDESIDLCGDYRSNEEGPVIRTGPPALEPGTVEYATTVFHEMLHCISDLYGLGLSEGKVRVLEQMIAAMFAQNPKWGKQYMRSILNPKQKRNHATDPDHPKDASTRDPRGNADADPGHKRTPRAHP